MLLSEELPELNWDAPPRDQGQCEKSRCREKPLGRCENIAVCAVCLSLVCDECRGEAPIYQKYTNANFSHDCVDLCVGCLVAMRHSFFILTKCQKFSRDTKKKISVRIQSLLDSINED